MRLFGNIDHGLEPVDSRQTDPGDSQSKAHSTHRDGRSKREKYRRLFDAATSPISRSTRPERHSDTGGQIIRSDAAQEFCPPSVNWSANISLYELASKKASIDLIFSPSTCNRTVFERMLESSIFGTDLRCVTPPRRRRRGKLRNRRGNGRRHADRSPPVVFFARPRWRPRDKLRHTSRTICRIER